MSVGEPRERSHALQELSAKFRGAARAHRGARDRRDGQHALVSERQPRAGSSLSATSRLQPSYQRQRVARALKSTCEDWVRERSVLKVQLLVRSSNQDVIAFYSTFGYIEGAVVVLGRFLDL
jgi:GNAT superfamily N-acetyltransferase